jgi:hypothetical protein
LVPGLVLVYFFGCPKKSAFGGWSQVLAHGFKF